MIRFGIVGAGGIAHKFSRDLKLVEGARLEAVSARNIGKALKYQKAYNTPLAFGSYEEMAHSDQVDAVYIATPHKFHYEHALMFIKAGKHVLIEKPITVNKKELELLIKEAKAHKVLMMEAMWTYFLPATLWLKKVIDHNILGKLKKATIKFGFPITLGKSADGRLLNPNLAGGGLLDLGVYNVYYYMLLSKTPMKSISTKAVMSRTGVDNDGVIKIINEDQTEFILKYSMTKILGDVAKLEFEFGTVTMKGFHGCEHIILNGKSIYLPHKGEGFTHEIESFVDNITNGQLENEVITYDKSLTSMGYLDLIRDKINLKYPFE